MKRARINCSSSLPVAAALIFLTAATATTATSQAAPLAAAAVPGSTTSGSVSTLIAAGPVGAAPIPASPVPATAPVPASDVAAKESTKLLKMLDMDDDLAMKHLRDQLQDGGSAGTAAPPAPTQAQAVQAAVDAEIRAHRHPPVVSAAYGTVINGTPHMQAVINWDDIETPVAVGSRLRGFTVSSITPRGATLVAGKKRLFAPLRLDGMSPVTLSTGLPAVATPVVLPVTAAPTSAAGMIPAPPVMQGTGQRLTASVLR